MAAPRGHLMETKIQPFRIVILPVLSHPRRWHSLGTSTHSGRGGKKGSNLSDILGKGYAQPYLHLIRSLTRTQMPRAEAVGPGSCLRSHPAPPAHYTDEQT